MSRLWSMTPKQGRRKLGHKTHATGFRIGIVKDWQSKWFAVKHADYRAMIIEDSKIRDSILSRYSDAGISRVEIERNRDDLTITIHTARPGIVIGRGGQRVEELRRELVELTSRRAVRLNVQEIRQPELDAYLVGRNVADQLERRIAFRRAIKQAAGRTIQAGAKGIKIIASGRLAGAEIARAEKVLEGRVPLHTLRADIDYSLVEAKTEYGTIGVKVWIYKGDILQTSILEEEEENIQPIEVVLSGDQSTNQSDSTTEISSPESVDIGEGSEKNAST